LIGRKPEGKYQARPWLLPDERLNILRRSVQKEHQRQFLGDSPRLFGLWHVHRVHAMDGVNPQIRPGFFGDLTVMPLGIGEDGSAYCPGPLINIGRKSRIELDEYSLILS